MSSWGGKSGVLDFVGHYMVSPGFQGQKEKHSLTSQQSEVIVIVSANSGWAI